MMISLEQAHEGSIKVEYELILNFGKGCLLERDQDPVVDSGPLLERIRYVQLINHVSREYIIKHFIYAYRTKLICLRHFHSHFT